MNNRTQTVMSMLKPKTKAFGFNQKELKSVAAQIADNLNSADDASDEDVNAEIESAIEAVLPILELGQKYASRVINDARQNDNEDNDSDEDSPSPSTPPKGKTNPKPSDDTPAYVKALIESIDSMKAEISNLKAGKVTDSRRAKLESLLKDTGAFGSRTLKSFARMKFDSDDEFDEFFSEVEDDLKTLNQERANEGLANLGAPAAGAPKPKGKEADDVLSDDDVKALAAI